MSSSVRRHNLVWISVYWPTFSHVLKACSTPWHIIILPVLWIFAKALFHNRFVHRKCSTLNETSFNAQVYMQSPKIVKEILQARTRPKHIQNTNVPHIRLEFQNMVWFVVWFTIYSLTWKIKHWKFDENIHMLPLFP